MASLAFFMVSTQAHAELPQSLHIDRSGTIVNGAGQPVPVHLWNVKSYCPQGTHVPSIRELAGSSGGKILDGGASRPKDFESVEAINDDGTKDSFYYLAETAGRECHYDLFWSSSVLRDQTNFNYTMNRSCGQLWRNDVFDQMFLRCFANQGEKK